MKCKTLVLSGGSVKGIGILGALNFLKGRCELSNIEYLYGCSVGSIICVFVALGFSIEEIFLHFLYFEFSLCAKVSKKDVQLIDYGRFIDTLELIILRKHGRNLTLSEIAKRGKRLYLVTYNYSKNKMELLSYETYPDMLCTEAISLSCAIPFIFSKTIYKKDLYFDGGLVCNFPLDVAIEAGRGDIVAINIFSEEKQHADDSIARLVLNIMFAPIQKQTQDTINKYKSRCLLIELKIPIPFTKFKLTAKEAVETFILGYFQARRCAS